MGQSGRFEVKKKFDPTGIRTPNRQAHSLGLYTVAKVNSLNCNLYGMWHVCVPQFKTTGSPPVLWQPLRPPCTDSMSLQLCPHCCRLLSSRDSDVSACPRHSLLCLKPQHHANPFSGSRVVLCGQQTLERTDRRKLTLTFEKFFKCAHKRWRYIRPCVAMTA